MSSPASIRTRMAPSPTGEYHIGHIRTLLYNFALAHQSAGQFIIRIEDTDQKRFVIGAQDRILQVIKDYGLSWDEGPDIGGPYSPYVQSERLNIYQKYLKQLLDSGQAYYCFCTEDRLTEMRDLQKASGKLPKYDRHCLSLSPAEVQKNLEAGLPYVVRLRIPDRETIVIEDLVRGKIKFNTNDVDDQVLVKSNGIPTYHFAAAVDDHLMNITHILRGDEWISSVPKLYTIYKYLDWELPKLAHLPVFLDPSGQGKMSKRKGTVSARSFLDDGYLPEALLNFLMLLGWNPGTEQELFSLDEFVKEFKIEKLHVKQPIFDRKKLDYFNGLYIREKITEAKYLEYFKKFLPEASDEQVKILAPILRSRLVKFSDLKTSLAFIFDDIKYDKELLLKKGTSPELAKEMLTKSINLLSTDFSDLVSRIQNLVSENSWNVGEFFMVFRVAICGVAFTPPVVDCLPALGQESTLRKLNLALKNLI
ncbi:glutamate--tRNA ligase [Candidatus Shapirobacteria bacterium]|nr:glutamate--tRNA ligase [Candidatus Shapirobacteria bacterium]